MDKLVSPIHIVNLEPLSSPGEWGLGELLFCLCANLAYLPAVALPALVSLGPSQISRSAAVLERFPTFKRLRTEFLDSCFCPHFRPLSSSQPSSPCTTPTLPSPRTSQSSRTTTSPLGIPSSRRTFAPRGTGHSSARKNFVLSTRTWRG